MNKESAFKVLRGRLYELERQKRDAELDAIRGEKQENGFGSQIRNYVLYPYQLVKDLRSGVATSMLCLTAISMNSLWAIIVGAYLNSPKREFAIRCNQLRDEASRACGALFS